MDTQEMERNLSWIFARRSIRRYQPEPVGEEKVEALLRAAMAAPSANNHRPWHFIVVDQREMLDEIARVHPHASMCLEATLAILVCGDPERSESYWVHDCAAATENLLLAATALELGSIWLGVYPRDEREQALRATLGVPQPIRIFSAVAIGYAAEHKTPRTQYDPARVHRGGW